MRPGAAAQIVEPAMIRAAAAASLLLLALPASGEEFGNDRFTALAKECRATAAQAPSATAIKIRDAAVAAHQRFRGNRVDPTGRIVFFGNTEVESDHESEDSVAPAQVPWRQVLGFWEALGEKPITGAASRALSAWYYPGALDDPPPAELVRRGASLGPLLEAIDKLDFSQFGERAGATKAAIQQSVIRASLSDVAWSGAFVAAVMREAGIDREKFAYHAAHVAYISAAVTQSVRDVSAGEGKHFFRACDPALTRPRPGDLLCYHRHVEGTRNPYVQEGPSLFRSIFRDFANGAPKIIRSHCDIVARSDLVTRRVTLIGGNVHDSVTERVLTLTGKGVLSSSQGTKQCAGNNPDRRESSAPNCNFNSQKWFVLLQARRT
jgi:hypothetical protein